MQQFVTMRPTVHPCLQWTGDNLTDFQEVYTPRGGTCVVNDDGSLSQTGDEFYGPFTIQVGFWMLTLDGEIMDDADLQQQFQFVPGDSPVSFTVTKP